MVKISGGRFVAMLTLALALLSIGAISTPAEAHRSRVVIGFGTYLGPHYYPPPYYYYPPPAYYAPAPVYYAPAPAVVTPSPNCRDYRGDATIDGSGGQPFYGRACLLPNGKWHIVR